MTANESFAEQELVIRTAVQGVSTDAAVSDAQQIARIYNHYVTSGGATYAIVHLTEDDINQLLQIELPDICFVAALGERIIGWASARRFSDRHGYRHSCETAIYLDTPAIGRGVADRLQQQIESHCRQNDIHHAMAKIIADNQRSIDFHIRHGYELVGIQKEIGNVDGEWSDVAILQRIFR